MAEIAPLPRDGREELTADGHEVKQAEQENIPLRTLEQVKADLAQAKKNKCEEEIASLMLRHGRLTDEAHAYVAREYPQ